MGEIKRAIILCAVSRPEQATDDKVSMKQQEADGRAICESNKWEIVDILRLPGYSRNFFTLTELSEYAQKKGSNVPLMLMEHIRRRDFDVLVTRQGDRLGRTQTLITEVIERTVKQARANVYLVESGLIDHVNFRGMAAITGFQASTNNDNLVRRRRETLNAHAEKGIPVTSTPMFPYKFKRNEKYQRTGLIIDETNRPLLTAVAQLLLEGVGWRLIEEELYNRFGFVREDGKPFSRAFFFKRIFTPTWWGHTARFYKSLVHGQGVDSWVYDEAISPPEDVLIFRNTHEPIWKDELASQVKKELLRRRMAVRGTARSLNSKKFAGLFVCGKCGRYMKTLSVRNWTTVVCHSRFFAPVDEESCPPSPSLPERRIKEYLTKRIQKVIETQDLGSFIEQPKKNDAHDELTRLTQEIENIDEASKRLIRKQAYAHDELNDLYDDELKSLAQRKSILRNRLQEVKSSIHSIDTSRQTAAYENIIEVGLENFWNLNPLKINQILHALFAGYCMVVYDGQISHDIPAIPTRRRK